MVIKVALSWRRFTGGSKTLIWVISGPSVPPPSVVLMVTVAAPEKLVVGVKTIPLFKNRLIFVGEPEITIGWALVAVTGTLLAVVATVAPTVMVTPAGTALRLARVKVPLLLGVRVVVTV